MECAAKIYPQLPQNIMVQEKLSSYCDVMNI